MNVEQKNLVPDSNQHQDVHTIITTISRVIRAEAESLLHLSKAVPAEAMSLVMIVLATKGKVMLLGIGKSGLVAQKMAATFSSLGIPAFFIHPTEALHGDLGAIAKEDVCIFLSKSGTGAELEVIAAVLAARKIQSVLIACARGSLAETVSLSVILPFDQEACFFGLAPTSSSTMMMAFGDAIAVAVSSLRQFTKQQFAAHHPAGALGRKLLFTVRSFMLTGNALPIVLPEQCFQDVLVTITAKKQGMVILVDACGALIGLITDGDLRRACEQGPSVFNKTAGDLATKSPKTVAPDTLAFVALEMMENFNITTLVVMENNNVVGVVHIHDLIKAGLV